MDDTLKTHLESLDYEVGWSDWRRHLKETIEDSREYYRDETITNLIERLTEFLHVRLAASSVQEGLIADLWDAADEEERRVLARLFFKIAAKI